MNDYGQAVRKWLDAHPCYPCKTTNLACERKWFCHKYDSWYMKKPKRPASPEAGWKGPTPTKRRQDGEGKEAERERLRD